jgi:hypothetical protein
MILRNLPAVFLLLAFALLAAAGCDYFFLQDAPGAAIVEPDRTFPTLAVGKNDVRFQLRNPTRHAVRVIGCQGCCGNVSFTLKSEIPLDIPAGGTVDLECTLEAFQPGEFASQIHIYLDDLGVRELIMTVQGTAK